MVKDTFKKFMSCWKPSATEDGGPRRERGESSTGPVGSHLLWTTDYGLHVNGGFSIAVKQANEVLEDQCQIESGSLNLDDNGPVGTFVGVYDGHAGTEAARFVNRHLFNNIKRLTSENGGMSADVIRQAYLATEEEFLTSVESEWQDNPKMASVGSCCLAGVICNGVLYIANAGDSRVVLAKSEDSSGNAAIAVRLSEEHNASYPSVREELQALHPNDPNIVICKQGVWRVRGLIQISRSIGDAYFKRFHFNRPPLLEKYIQAQSFTEPILKAEPATRVQEITAEDQFLIFASDGLWEHLTDQEAVNIVKRSPRNGIAKVLVKAALVEAARKHGITYSGLELVEKGVRRQHHDDITVIVVFLNHDSAGQTSSAGPVMSSVKSPLSF